MERWSVLFDTDRGLHNREIMQTRASIIDLWTENRNTGFPNIKEIMKLITN
jgi:hypothetical protein